MNGDNLKLMVKNHGKQQVYRKVVELLEKGRKPGAGDKGLRYSDLGLREIAEAFCGEQWVSRMGAAQRGGFTPLMESGDAVDVSAFSNITGQIIFSKILESYQFQVVPIEALVEIVPSQFAHERFPRLGNLPKDGEEIHPGMPYPRAGFGENYVDTPDTVSFT